MGTQNSNKLPTRLFRYFLVYLIAVCSAVFLLNYFSYETAPTLNPVPYPVNKGNLEKQEDPIEQGTQKITLLFWSKLWKRPAKQTEGFLPKGTGKGQCPVACEVTCDRKRIQEADAFIVHARDPYPLPPHKKTPWMLTTMENPVYTPVLRNPKYMSQFHLLRSYRLDSDYPTPAFKKPGLDPPVSFKNKTGGIMAAFSNCEAVRTEYLRQLMQYVPVDSYGGCLRNKPGLVRRYGKDFKQVKSELQRKYKFAITFFNQDCDYFVDDQIRHALNAGSVPVVMSTDKIKEFLPGNLKNAFINVRDFKNPELLAKHLKFLMKNETEYNKHLEWKTKGLGDINGTVIGQYWNGKFNHWCRACQAIARGEWHKEGLKVDLCTRRKYENWGITQHFHKKFT